MATLRTTTIFTEVSTDLRWSPESWAEIHQALLSKFSLLEEFLIGKLSIKTKMAKFKPKALNLHFTRAQNVNNEIILFKCLTTFKKT